MITRYMAFIVAAGALQGCATAEPTADSAEAYRPAIARALRYYAGDRDAKHYSISAPWRTLTGAMVVCVREDVHDGRGGWAPTTDYSMFFIDNGRINDMVKDNTLAGCPNRTYGPFAPIPR
jgi:hypothetical protein